MSILCSGDLEVEAFETPQALWKRPKEQVQFYVVMIRSINRRTRDLDRIKLEGRRLSGASRTSSLSFRKVGSRTTSRVGGGWLSGWSHPSWICETGAVLAAELKVLELRLLVAVLDSNAQLEGKHGSSVT